MAPQLHNNRVKGIGGGKFTGEPEKNMELNLSKGGGIMRHQDREKELKELSHAIVEALTHNDDVMALLTDLKERQVIDSSTLLGLALKISDLLELSGIAFTQEDVEKAQNEMFKDNKPATESGAAESKEDDIDTKLFAEAEKDELSMIDGHRLTESEAAFQEWANGKFDEKEWLKNARLLW